MQHTLAPHKYHYNWFWAICILTLFCIQASAQVTPKKLQDTTKKKQDTSKNIQDTTKPLLDINNSKIIKKVNSILDTNQKMINNFLLNKVNKIKGAANDQANKAIKKVAPLEIEKPLPYERLLNTKYSLGRRAYQNTVSQFNYLFNAEEELKDNILRARSVYEDDYTSLISFYDYDLSLIAKRSIDSIIYRCNANIVLHDLRSNWVDDAYLLLAKAYLFHKNFDTAGSILQFINYSFDDKENGMDLPIGSNMRNKGKFSIATPENNRFFENVNVRNESMIWQARNYFEKEELNEGLSLLQLLQSDAIFPKRLYPFLNEQLAYGYYQMEIYDKAAAALEKGFTNAPDEAAKTRWYYLIAQLWQSADKWDNAYNWYKKANQHAVNPIVGVYAKINMISIESKNANNSWEALANTLEKMTKKERYKPYADIIYFEMAKLAIQNKSYSKANEWLIKSIQKNTTNLKQKQKAFELLGDINYQHDVYTIAEMAYDSLQTVIKTNPNYETIQSRKKWISTINKNDKIIKSQDTLQSIYNIATENQQASLERWQKKTTLENEFIKNIFIDKSASTTGYTPLDNLAISNSRIDNTSNSDFYFDNKAAVTLGKQNFTQKWGERPNVDQWRRKTSTAILYAANKNGAPSTSQKQPLIPNQMMPGDTSQRKGKLGKEEKAITYSLIANPEDLQKSFKEWNMAALTNAQTFLLQLNDFEKAYPIYLKIINKNIDSTITERALLDLASQYLHDNLNEKSDSIIQLVLTQFPNGFYTTKKNESLLKKKKESIVLDDYKEAYFLSQIGNWDSLTVLSKQIMSDLRKTKWNTPFKFIQVKMYAQQKKDSAAYVILDSIVLQNTNEKIRDKAKNIITELKNRKQTEYYLSNLNIAKLIAETTIDTAAIAAEVSNLNNAAIKDTNKRVIDSSQTAAAKKIASIDTASIGNKEFNKKTQKGIGKIMAGTTKVDTVTIAAAPVVPVIPLIQFANDSAEQHYIALATNKVSAAFVKEMQNAFTYLNSDEFRKQKLSVTYVQFNEDKYIVWIGPFENRINANSYITKIKPRLSSEIISFVPTKQYEIYLLGKTNILLIKDTEDLKQYQQFMFKNIYKP